jgi:hypothetical protein
MTLVRVPDVEPRHELRAWIEILAPAAELARTIAPTDFVPRAYRNNPPAITAAVLYGDEIGLGPLVAVNEIHVIEGRVFVSAEAQRALVLAAGHEVWPEELTTTRATWCGRRRGSEQTTRITWTLDDARRARIDGKPNWKGYPRQMLSARASAELCRAIYADVIGGIGVLEEFDDPDDAAATPGAVAPAPRSTRSRRGKVAAAATAPEPGPATVPELPPLPGETTTDLDDAQRSDVEDAPQTAELLTPSQLRRLQALFRAKGIETQADRRALEVEIVGHDLASTKALTVDEGDRVIGHLEALPTPGDEQADVPPEGDDAQQDLGV